MRFGTWKVGSLFRKTVARYEYVDLMGVQEVRWGRGGTEPADDYAYSYDSYGNEMTIMN
jgi:hypothetical protein